MVIVRAGLAFLLGFTALVAEYLVSVATLAVHADAASALLFLPLPLYAAAGVLGLDRLDLRAGFGAGLAAAIVLWVVALDQGVALNLLFTVPALVVWFAATWWRRHRWAIVAG